MHAIEPRSSWLHVTGKTALVFDVDASHISCVYDRVDDPNGPASQYGLQRFTAEQFVIEHHPAASLVTESYLTTAQ